MKKYDQSVTSLADDLQTLETRRSTLCTPETLPQTNYGIHKHSSKKFEEKILENFENKQLNLATENNF